MIPPSISSTVNSPNRKTKHNRQVQINKTILPTRLCDYFLILGPGKVITTTSNHNNNNNNISNEQNQLSSLSSSLSSSSPFFHTTIISTFPDQSFYKKQKMIIPDLLGN